jgi:hypothetical protein
MVQTELGPTPNVTGVPLTPPSATTVKLSPIFEVGGAGVGNVMLWLSGVAFVLSAPEPAE